MQRNFANFGLLHLCIGVSSTNITYTDFSTNRKLIYDFLLVINTILHRFQVMTDYIASH